MTRINETRTVQVSVVRCDLCDAEVNVVERSDDPIVFMPVRATSRVEVELIHDELDREYAPDVDLCRTCRGDLGGWLQAQADNHRGEVTL